MNKVLKFLLELAVALIVVTFIINCQKQQRKHNVNVETLGIGQHKTVYYQYQDYISNKSLKNN